MWSSQGKKEEEKEEEDKGEEEEEEEKEEARKKWIETWFESIPAGINFLSSVTALSMLSVNLLCFTHYTEEEEEGEKVEEGG